MKYLEEYEVRKHGLNPNKPIHIVTTVEPQRKTEDGKSVYGLFVINELPSYLKGKAAPTINRGGTRRKLNQRNKEVPVEIPMEKFKEGDRGLLKQVLSSPAFQIDASNSNRPIVTVDYISATHEQMNEVIALLIETAEENKALKEKCNRLIQVIESHFKEEYLPRHRYMEAKRRELESDLDRNPNDPAIKEKLDLCKLLLASSPYVNQRFMNGTFLMNLAPGAGVMVGDNNDMNIQNYNVDQSGAINPLNIIGDPIGKPRSGRRTFRMRRTTTTIRSQHVPTPLSAIIQ